jgi:hypothetical protein
MGVINVGEFVAELREKYKAAKNYLRVHMKAEAAKMKRIDEQLQQEIEKRQELEMKVQELDDKLGTVTKQLEKLQNEKETLQKRLMVRQLAYSYQSKLAKFVNAPPTKFTRTHNQITVMKGIDTTRLSTVEGEFFNLGYTDSVDIDNGVKEVRELSADLSHPSVDVDGSQVTADRLRNIVVELFDAKLITLSQKDAALDLIKAIEFMCNTPGFVDTNLLNS